MKKAYYFLREIKDNILISQMGFLPRCKHLPTCSVYMERCVKKEGVLGFVKGLWRVCCCVGYKHPR